jgi:hypothetical protein
MDTVTDGWRVERRKLGGTQGGVAKLEQAVDVDDGA